MKPSRHILITLLLLLVYWAFIYHIAIFAPLDLAVFAFSEEGTIEILSPLLWFLLALFYLFGRMALPTRLASAVMAVLFGLREMDMHKSFFQVEGQSTHFLRSNFYFTDIEPLSHKIIGGIFALAILALAFYLIKTFVISFKRSRKPRNPAYGYTALGFVLLVISKFADRLNSDLQEIFNITLPPRSVVLVQAFEESTEMILPVILCIAVILYERQTLPDSKH
ncbi:hypothetical protein [Neisseria perflava]|uniref:hypothetical protein n=1 Tax=Neisseria perflava TaxID=33053 RepID=UPI00209FAEC6|nr:hypothetical protein [Neisseria perflava]MCP1659945.1 putative membrane protein (GlpM family) [Neisseria perflava]MCP1772207.1 putative membrane protein (GlpM family) [Neisseria perflava]